MIMSLLFFFYNEYWHTVVYFITPKSPLQSGKESTLHPVNKKQSLFCLQQKVSDSCSFLEKSNSQIFDLFSINFNIILPTMSGLPKWCIHISLFQIEWHRHFSHAPCMLHALSSLLQHTIRWWVQILRSLMCNFLQSHFILSLRTEYSV